MVQCRIHDTIIRNISLYKSIGILNFCNTTYQHKFHFFMVLCRIHDTIIRNISLHKSICILNFCNTTYQHKFHFSMASSYTESNADKKYYSRVFYIRVAIISRRQARYEIIFIFWTKHCNRREKLQKW